MALERTDDPALALAWAEERLGAGNPVAFLLAPRRFGFIERTPEGLSLTLTGDEWFGACFGTRPPLRDEWRRCAVSASSFGDHLLSLARVDEWDFFTRRVASGGATAPADELHDDDAVARFLEAHAPHSAVWPGHHEVVAWYGASDAHGLVAVAALVRWESGYHVVSSVATRADARGRGHGARLMVGVAAAARERGVEWLGLGVAHDNEPAHRLYRATGFELRAAFTSYGAHAHAGPH